MPILANFEAFCRLPQSRTGITFVESYDNVLKKREEETMKRNFFMLLVIVLVLVFAVACSEPALELTSVRDYEEENLINYFNGLQTILLSSVQVWDAHPDSVGDMISGEYSLTLAEGDLYFDITWNNFDFDKIEEGLAQSLMIFPVIFLFCTGPILLLSMLS